MGSKFYCSFSDGLMNPLDVCCTQRNDKVEEVESLMLLRREAFKIYFELLSGGITQNRVGGYSKQH